MAAVPTPASAAISRSGASTPARTNTTAPLTIHRYMSFEHTLDTAVAKRMAAYLAAGIRLGAIRPTIGKTFDLPRAAEAHRYLEEGRNVGKIVLTP